MANPSPVPKKSLLPDGFSAIPISRADAHAPLRLCILTRKTPDPAVGRFIVLRDLFDALVYLGCVVDASGRPREWVEIWVQNVDGLDSTLPAQRESFSNTWLDARWTSQAEAIRDLAPDQFIQTGWESAHPPPSYVDPASAQPADLGEGAEAWTLCQNDEWLRAAGLPDYRTSLFRYLHQPSAGAQTRFIAAVAGAPQSAATVSLSAALPALDPQAALNPQGGLMMVIGFAPLSFEEHADLLAGKPWSGLEHGKARVTLEGAYQSLLDAGQVQSGLGQLFSAMQGRAGRVVEALYLKLQLVLDCLRAVQLHAERQQLPFLNLGADSFRVGLLPVGNGLPFLWTARGYLVKPSHAFALPVESSDFRYFLRARNAGASIYLPEGLSASVQGSGSVRVRKVQPPQQGRTVLEGTLVAQEPLSVSPNDLLWIRLPLPSGRVDLYGHAYAAESLAEGEVRFRTVPQQLSEAAMSALKAAEGVSFARSPFEVVPLLSAPCDMYSMGVLAVRALLVDEKLTLAVALDEMLSLARQVASEHKPEVPVGARVGEILGRDRRYMESLGPQRLTRAGLTAEEAMDCVPQELWQDVLGLVLRLFPGMGPDSFCRDYGDAPALALEKIFDGPVGELEKLLVRSRSLVLVDWKYHREVGAAIRECLAK